MRCYFFNLADWQGLKNGISQCTEDVGHQMVSSVIGGSENWWNLFGEHFDNIQ